VAEEHRLGSCKGIPNALEKAAKSSNQRRVELKECTSIKACLHRYLFAS